ncbi:MAG: flagellar basal body P-ring formation chaperone FlgA [Betaproteobacteria bacterium]
MWTSYPAATTLLRALPLALAALGAQPCAYAQPAADAPAAQAIRMFLERETTGLEGRVAIEFGAPDPHARPAPCARIEPFLPSGARLWGRSTVGLRCSDGTRWSTFLPVTVRVFAPTLVAGRSLPAGHALAEDDYRSEEIDLTQQPAGLLSDAGFAAQKVLSRPVAAGQPLRREHFRPRALVAPGDPVRLVYEGSGFSVSTQGRSLGSATEGEPVRVQTESGRVVTGFARGTRRVELRP